MKLIVLALCISVAAAAQICGKKVAFQSTTSSMGDNGYAERAVDDDKNPTHTEGAGCTHTHTGDPNPWIIVDLGCDQTVSSVSITNRNKSSQRLFGFVVTVNKFVPNPDDVIENVDVCIKHHEALPGGETQLECYAPIEGRYLMLRFTDPSEHTVLGVRGRFLHICDISVP